MDKLTLILSASALSLLPATLKASEKQPNIVLICLDDSGFGDFSFNGGCGYRTPNVDALASMGMRFTHYLAPQPISGASRAGLMTGCYPNRIGFRGAPGPGSAIHLHESETTIGEMLQGCGYITAIVGKWHLGDSREYLPLRNGFDEYFGLPYSNDMTPEFKSTFPALPLYKGEDVIEQNPDVNTLTTRYTEYATDFITRNRKKPFFLYLAHSMPHIPLGVSDRFRGKSGAGLYGDVMMEIDWSIGEIVKSLRKNKLEKNTLVIVISDNGPWLNFGNHAGSTGGLREAKGTTFDGGLRTPCVMYWKGHTIPGACCPSLISGIDFLPTFARICGAKLPDVEIDGISFADVINGDLNARPRPDFAFYYKGNDLEAVTDGMFKLVLPHSYLTYEEDAPGMDGNRGKVRRRYLEHEALFDLRMDPGERREVQDIYPDVMERMHAIVEKYRSTLGDDLTSRPGTSRRLH